MGKGIALQFKRRFPDNFRAYTKACTAGLVIPGRMFIFATSASRPKYIINFPTKRHWRDRSLLYDIRMGLEALVAEVGRLGIRSLAIPPLGCGNGGLHWDEVEPLIRAAMEPLPEVRTLVYRPDAPR
jgi:O-acetyl-ADP-ribose deacetylase (regulator of RNase III)